MTNEKEALNGYERHDDGVWVATSNHGNKIPLDATRSWMLEKAYEIGYKKAMSFCLETLEEVADKSDDDSDETPA